MDYDPDLEKRRKEVYAAQNHFRLDPNPATKAAFKKASSAFNTALHHAGKKVDNVPLGPAEGLGEGSMIKPRDAALIEAARCAQNAAYRAMYADPCEETREKWKQARNEYKKVRRRLDPAFRALLSESTRKSQAKNKT